MAKNLRDTTLIELVETHNIAKSLARLQTPYGNDRWRRALYHAICMEVGEWEVRQKIREALKLP